MTQRHKDGRVFSNYEFEFVVLRMQAEHERFSWGWIRARGDNSLSHAQANVQAPEAWKEWVAHGQTAMPRLRRNVLRRELTSKSEQLPAAGSTEEKTLKRIYDHYTSTSKIHFESLAAAVAAAVISPGGAAYKTHGITPGTGDFGIDFIGQLDVGHGFSRTPLVVLGQAKCVKVGGQIDARDLARTVARLRRGWLGVFVTTGAVSKRAQREVYDDRYPLLLITGLQVAQTAEQLLQESPHGDLADLLKQFDEDYKSSPRVADPERLVS